MLYFLAFITGIAIGGGIVRQLVRQHWREKLRAEKRSLLTQYESELSHEKQQRMLLEKASQQLTQQKEADWQDQARSHSIEAQEKADQITQLRSKLASQQQSIQQLSETLESEAKNRDELIATEQQRYQTEIADCKREYEALIRKTANEYEAQLTEEQEQNAALKQQNRENIDISMQLSKEVEKEKNELRSQNQKLTDQIQRLESAIATQEQAYEEKLEIAPEGTDLDLVEIVEALFPAVELLYHSKTEIRQHNSEFVSLLLALKGLTEEEQLSQPKKVHATSNKWWEGRIGRQGRLYYHKASSHRDNDDTPLYRIVIAWKSGYKDQKKVIDWLKHNYRE